MKILVTGANGYLGQGIVEAILNRGHKVIAADIKVNHVDERAQKKICNLFEVESPYEYFDEPDVLLHLAWRETGGSKEDCRGIRRNDSHRRQKQFQHTEAL